MAKTKSRERMRIKLVTAFLSAATLLNTAPAAPPSDDTYLWALDVLFGFDFDKNLNTVRRWVFSPSLSVYSENPAHHQLVHEVVTKINHVLADTPIKHIRLFAPRNPHANIKVHFVPLAQLPALSKKASFDYVDGNLGVFWLKWNKYNQINASLVLLAEDKLQGDILRHFAFEEITQSLGLPGDSMRFRDSIFYAGDFEKGDPVTITDRDARLIRLLYKDIWVGASRKKVIEAVTDHWQEVP
jgi:hypothetical protein